jgi:L-fucose dehydrogenase
MELNLKDKIIVVSGGAKNIGENIVKVLAIEGAIPIIIGRNENDNLKTVEGIKSLGGKCFQTVAELTKPDECESSIKKIIKEFGAIHGLVNNADVNDGIGLEYGNYEAFIASLHKNIVHYYLLTHYALPELKKTKSSIVNINFKTAGVSKGNTAYTTIIDGKNALTREWAVELLKYNIRVNAVIAPVEKTQEINLKIPLKNKITTAEEIANTVAFLLSEKSSHTTGQLIHVDGGYVHFDRALVNV